MEDCEMNVPVNIVNSDKSTLPSTVFVSLTFNQKHY